MRYTNEKGIGAPHLLTTQGYLQTGRLLGSDGPIHELLDVPLRSALNEGGGLPGLVLFTRLLVPSALIGPAHLLVIIDNVPLLVYGQVRYVFETAHAHDILEEHLDLLVVLRALKRKFIGLVVLVQIGEVVVVRLEGRHRGHLARAPSGIGTGSGDRGCGQGAQRPFAGILSNYGCLARSVLPFSKESVHTGRTEASSRPPREGG